MPISVTFDFEGLANQDYNRIQSAFERLGWENSGGSSYRYPKLGTDDQPIEDWFNHVVPALVILRALALAPGRNMTKFTIDAQSSTGHRPNINYGEKPKKLRELGLYQANNNQFGEANLKEFIDGINWPYAP